MLCGPRNNFASKLPFILATMVPNAGWILSTLGPLCANCMFLEKASLIDIDEYVQ